MRVEDLPAIIEPKYWMNEPNEEIPLHQGRASFTQKDIAHPGQATVKLCWLPTPAIRFEFTPDDASVFFDFDPATLFLTGLNASTRALVLRQRIPHLRDSAVHGIMLEPFDYGVTAGLHQVRFHMPNLPEYQGAPVRTANGGSCSSRIGLSTTEWNISMDVLRFNGGLRGRAIQDVRGYGITHAGIIQRNDGNPFSSVELQQLLSGLDYFMSFCRGAWVGATQLVFEDKDGLAVGGSYRLPASLDPWIVCESWVPLRESPENSISRVFPGFMRHWHDRAKHGGLRRQVEWYIEGNRGPAERSVILLQSALESASFLRNPLSADGWKKLCDADQLRLLLAESDLSRELPAHLSGCLRYLKVFTLPVQDGPGVLSEYRNACLHPANPNKQGWWSKDPDAAREVWLLVLWYLDLVLLRAFGYVGRYSNRLIRGVSRGQEVEVVPWAAP